MKKVGILVAIILVGMVCSFSPGNQQSANSDPYHTAYGSALYDLENSLQQVASVIKSTESLNETTKKNISSNIAKARLSLKNADIWLRYMEPVAYNKINGPLPVEWENEVFEKFEKPYKREGAGLSLAELYLANNFATKDSLLNLIRLAQDEMGVYKADSITSQMNTFDHFLFANRLHLLNLAAIYTTGFECPNNDNIIPELRAMMRYTQGLYRSYNLTFPQTPITAEYLDLYTRATDFANKQPDDFTKFDFFTFVKNFVNPLFAANQQLIAKYKARSVSYNDFTLSNTTNSIFDKALYAPQNTKGIYSLVEDKDVLAEIKATGKLLFYDPILSGNNERSCASCHKPTQYFTDTTVQTAPQFNKTDRLPRNTPTLIDVVYNHLLMLDGKHITLQAQGRDVTSNPKEMGCTKETLVKKVMSCKEYRKALTKFLAFTPAEKEVTIDHIVSCITYYYSDYSSFYSPFDDAMNENVPLSEEARLGFNLFMGKAQCGTCHYVPQFNGVRPPYISSEFEVIGVPDDTTYKNLSADKGRYLINPAGETMNAFRTGSIRNAEYTKPYMHNGVFNSLEQVVDFYDAGGGTGKKLHVPNQTLSAEPLKLTADEKKELISFIHSLNEKIIFQQQPDELPRSSDKTLNGRKVGGLY
jgi:cytochrome c peroxidase